MPTSLLWIAGLWLGLGLVAGLMVWFSMAVSRKLASHRLSAVRPLPSQRPEEKRAAFRLLVGSGEAKPMRLTDRNSNRAANEATLICLPGTSHKKRA
jgi:hypothetical protein